MRYRVRVKVLWCVTVLATVLLCHCSRVCAGVLEYAQVARGVFKVRVLHEKPTPMISILWYTQTPWGVYTHELWYIHAPLFIHTPLIIHTRRGLQTASHTSCVKYPAVHHFLSGSKPLNTRITKGELIRTTGYEDFALVTYFFLLLTASF